MPRLATLALALAVSVFTAACHVPQARTAAMIEVIPRGPSVLDGSEPAAVRDAAEATADEIEIARSTFLTSEQRRRDAHNQRTLARAERILAAGGYKASLRAEAEELEKRPPRSSPDVPDRGSVQSAADREKLRFDCKEPTIQVVNDWDSTVEPDVDVIIEGCLFGIRTGEVRLVVNQFGGYLALEVKIWTEDVILAKLPPMESVVDQPANLLIIRANGVQSSLYPVEFRATRDIQLLSGRFFTHIFTSQRTDFDLFGSGEVYCAITDPATGHGIYAQSSSFVAYHGTRNDINGHYNGHDVWTLDLLNGWVISSWAIGKASSFTNGEFSVATGIVIGSPTLNLDVDWDINAFSETVGYLTYVLVAGPKGTPYATDINPGLVITDPNIDVGLPCTGS